MLTQCLPGILIPFAGTTLGSACVFFMKKTLHEGVQRALTGFAAGVMVAASIWSLLIPAMEQSEGLGRLAFMPAAVGFWLGIGFLLLLDMAVPHLHQGADTPEGPHSGFSRTTMLVLAVTLHNIPEGMAVGVVYAGYLTGSASDHGDGRAGAVPGHCHPELSRGRDHFDASESRGHEPAAGRSGRVRCPAPWSRWAHCLPSGPPGWWCPPCRTCSALPPGAMLYVVVEELIPEMSQGEHSNVGTICFALGFSVMMVLDVALG